jgi:predicted aspartyl protease
VQVAINNSPPQWFILDSGAAGGSILAKETADRLGLKGGAESRKHIGAGAGVDVGIATIPDVTLNVAGDSMTLPEMRVFSMAHIAPYEGRQLGGLLGEDFFQRNVVEIDYAKRTLRIIDPDAYTPGPAATVVPITVENGHAVAESAIQRAGEAPIPCRFVIDTGVRTTLVVYSPFVMQHRLLETKEPMITATIGGGAGGETRGDLARLEKLQIGPLEFARIPVVFSRDTAGAFATDEADGIVGGEILRRYKTTFDYPHSRMVLEAYPGAPPFEYDMSGLFLVGQGTANERVTILSVAARTPAAEALLQKGDEIVAVNGRQASKVGLDGVRQLFRAPATYRLVVKRGDAKLNVELKTRRIV